MLFEYSSGAFIYRIEKGSVRILFLKIVDFKKVKTLLKKEDITESMGP